MIIGTNFDADNIPVTSPHWPRVAGWHTAIIIPCARHVRDVLQCLEWRVPAFFPNWRLALSHLSLHLLSLHEIGELV